MGRRNNELTPSKLYAVYPKSRVSSEARLKVFETIWPEIKRLYEGENEGLFRSFSSVLFSSFNEIFSEGMAPKQYYHLLKNFFDFIMEDMERFDTGNGNLPEMLVKVEQPREETLPSAENKIAFTNILIHTLDSPFLFENIAGYLNLAKHHVITGITPVLTVMREKGKIVDFLPSSEEGPKEVFINFRIAKLVNPDSIKKITTEIEATLRALSLTVTDFHKMTNSVLTLSEELKNDANDPEDGVETASFLGWLIPANMIFMGLRSYEISATGSSFMLKEGESELLGVFRDRKLMDIVYPDLGSEIKSKILKSINRPYIMALDFLSNSPRILYHDEAVDAVFIRQFNKGKTSGKVTVLLGRFSRGALLSKATDLPFLRTKLKRLLESEKVRPRSHIYREFFSTFNILPKKELFYIDRVTLAEIMNIAVRFQSEDELHILLRQSADFGYLTVTLILSTKKFRQKNISKIRKYFNEALGSDTLFMQTSQSTVVSTIFLYYPLNGEIPPKLDLKKMAEEIRELITEWDELVQHKMIERYGDQEAFSLFNGYVGRLTDLYRQAVKPENAVSDIVMLRDVDKPKADVQMDIQRQSHTSAVLRLFWNRELSLMKLIPTFSNLGINVVEEIALPLKAKEEDGLYVQLLTIEDDSDKIQQMIAAKTDLIKTIQLVISGKAEDCRLNSLVLSAGLSWKQVDVVRSYQNYVVQINGLLNPKSVTDVLISYPEITFIAIDFFEEKFDPKRGDAEKMETLKSGFVAALEKISDLNEDSILRLLFKTIEATVRTNYFKPKTEHSIAIKVDCGAIPSMPKPVPMAEIYVHTPRLEGVHLRGGKVARGGLRWSDRPDDFRSEVLGLMKTQMVKNAVIVPAGSKGGFVLKKFKFETMKERNDLFKHHYQTFIRGLLDLTDNLVDGKHLPPQDVVCYDEPDPYLVVAADKGTATMSDAANEVSAEYSYWLGDAFASGGSIGYDHKKFGITAKGAWECIKRHFRELGIDIQNESITVAGIGSMDGDVFGNGMLLSRKIKLVAAFSHLHIFLDPNPDTEKSFKERERLFNTPGTTWMDYKPDLISTGGGIYSRTAKLISLSPEAMKSLGTSKSEMSGQELIRTILKMKVDLLYCGGIGTYLRASSEANSEISDKANASVRVASSEVQARVIGEGANLALTQPARIEYAVNGGVINTDSIDNSAGVDTSDHEVNLKILLEILLEKKILRKKEERNSLFSKVGPEIAEMVLKDNYYQSAGISMDRKRSEKKLEEFADYIDWLESKGLIDREDEHIPDRETIISYEKKPGHLPRPVLSVLFGYEKIRINEAILNSPIVDTSFANRYLHSYFPAEISDKYEQEVNGHRLKNEIISTLISNKIVNQVGLTTIQKIETITEVTTWEVVRAYMIAGMLLDSEGFRDLVHGLDNKVDADTQNNLLLKLENLIFKTVLWMLKHLEPDRINFDFISQYQAIIRKFKENLYEKLESICSLEKGYINKRVAEYEKKNIPPELGKLLVILPYLKDVMSIISIKEEQHAHLIETGNLYIHTANSLELDWIYNALENFNIETAWEKKSVENLARELELYQGELVLHILNFRRKNESMEKAFKNYLLERIKPVAEYRETIAKMKEESPNNLLAIGVLIRQLSDMM
jgi:glutamate dehydrogenase